MARPRFGIGRSHPDVDTVDFFVVWFFSFFLSCLFLTYDDHDQRPDLTSRLKVAGEDDEGHKAVLVVGDGLLSCLVTT